MGTADLPGMLIGFPTLDHEPFGFGYQRREYTHYFSKFGEVSNAYVIYDHKNQRSKG